MKKIKFSDLGSSKAILVLEFSQISPDLQKIFDVGGDEDVVILVPKDYGLKQSIFFGYATQSHPFMSDFEDLFEDIEESGECRIQIDGQIYFWYTVIHS